MTGNLTLTIIKPHAVTNNQAIDIMSMITRAGFRISAMKMIRLTKSQTEGFYNEHKGREFYEPLVEMMSSGAVIVALLEKDNAVSELRKLVGTTDPEKAESGTVRKLFGVSTRENAIHASDSDQNAIREAGFFFSAIERL